MNYEVWIDAAKAFMQDRLEKRIVEFVVSHFAFFASGPLGYILGKVAAKLAEFLADTAELRAFYAYADFRSNRQGQAFAEDAIQYRLELESGDGESIAKARDKVINSFRNFVKF